jgi:hypothetical protein
MLTKFNDWYDKKKEPERFWFFLLIFATPYSVALFNILDSVHRFLPLWLCVLIFIFVFIVTISRMIRKISEKK